ncbi:MAG TPA: D-2-hydroxyacid dehydrogenase [Chryseolinea sp.]|nr:D-2-hydroxyacid dehydrogenase [Chryseolinea sp.]
MKVVVIDGHTLNPGDLSWKELNTYGDVTLYDRTLAEQITERCKIAEIILTNKVPLSATTVEAAKDLKLICVTATGFNIVDVEAASKRKIPVCNVPDYGTSSVAQHTFALILELANRVGVNSSSVRQGEWERSPDFCFSKGRITELQGKTMGIIGLGKIGTQVARLAAAFEMRVIYNSQTKKENNLAAYADLEEVFSQSDIVSLHCPLTRNNNQFVNRNLLSKMKPSAWIINTSRGQLINENDLADALNTDQLAAAAVDVLSVEPPPATNPLLQAKNCVVSPHTAWMSLEARKRILSVTLQNIDCYLKGKPQNLVSKV